MRPVDVNDLNSFVRELELETDRGLPLVGAALIDDRLQETLRAFFRAMPWASSMILSSPRSSLYVK